MTQLCGDETCESPACSSDLLDTFLVEQQEAARILVRTELGLPL